MTSLFPTAAKTPIKTKVLFQSSPQDVLMLDHPLLLMVITTLPLIWLCRTQSIEKKTEKPTKQIEHPTQIQPFQDGSYRR